MKCGDWLCGAAAGCEVVAVLAAAGLLGWNFDAWLAGGLFAFFASFLVRG